MLGNIILIFRDRIYLLFAAAAFLLSVFTFYLFYQLIARSERIWLAPIFTPIHFYVIVIFVINLSLSLVSWRRDRFLSLAFNFTTLAVNVLLIIALILNLVNPNG